MGAAPEARVICSTPVRARSLRPSSVTAAVATSGMRRASRWIFDTTRERGGRWPRMASKYGRPSVVSYQHSPRKVRMALATSCASEASRSISDRLPAASSCRSQSAVSGRVLAMRGARWSTENPPRRVMEDEMKVWILFALLGATFNAFAGSVHLMARLDGKPSPSIVGTTNLPEGTRIATDLVCPLMYCREFWSASSEATVHNGSFASKPISYNGSALPPSRYQINVVVFVEQGKEITSKLRAMGWDGRKTIAFKFDTGPADASNNKQEQAEDHGATVTMAEFSGRSGNAASQHGWTHLGESESDSYWFSYWTDQENHEVAVVMKDGIKGVGDGYVQVKFITGFVDCRGSER